MRTLPPPAVGTFYGFIDRLEDGPSAPPWPPRVRPSHQRKGRHRRPLTQDKAARQAAQAAAPRQGDAVTARRAQDRLATAEPPRPQERLTRREDLLCTCGVWPAATRGLRGALQELVLCGASAALPTGASPHGPPPVPLPCAGPLPL